jgi:hypothetical protein
MHEIVIIEMSSVQPLIDAEAGIGRSDYHSTGMKDKLEAL